MMLHLSLGWSLRPRLRVPEVVLLLVATRAARLNPIRHSYLRLLLCLNLRLWVRVPEVVLLLVAPRTA